MSDEQDPVLHRAIESLRELPDVDPAAIERAVAAAAAARATPSDDLPLLAPPRRAVRPWMIGAVAAAAIVVGFVLRGAMTRPPESNAPATSTPAKALQPVASTAEQKSLPIMEQFVFNSRTAHRVSVVGDFNGWNPTAAPMIRSADGDLWSTTIPILPGRHLFAFMVDDSIVLDSRSPKVLDPDLGTEGSVIIVGRP